MNPLIGPHQSAIDLESVISTAALSQRPSRPPDHAAENRALVALTEAMSASPSDILQKLVETALGLCRAHSAGISLLEQDRQSFYWPAIAGQWVAHVGGGTPRDFGPCGTVLDRHDALLFSHPERHFGYLATVTPAIEEALLIPFYVGGEAVGTIWVIAHDQSRRFDAEDLRVMTHLGKFASGGYQVLQSLNAATKALQELQQIASAQSRLAAIVESSDDAIISKTLDGIMTSWNRGAERIFGYTEPEAIGKSILLIIPEERRAEEDDVVARLRRGEKIDHFETERLAKDGRRVSISLTVSPVRNAQGDIVGASKVARDITERKLAEQELRRAHEQLESRVRERTAELAVANESLRLEMGERQRAEQARLQLLSRFVFAQEDERRRIAREMHDQLGQQLTALKLNLETLKARTLEVPELCEYLDSLETVAQQLGRDIDFLIWELRPTVLDDIGLPAALIHYVRNWSKHTGIPARLHTRGPTDSRLTSEIETTFYRLAQEALNNVAKHARAAGVEVILERDSGYVALIIEDNGVGFDPEDATNVKHGLGLVGMRERAALVGATFQIESAPGKGTTIFVRAAAPVVKDA